MVLTITILIVTFCLEKVRKDLSIIDGTLFFFSSCVLNFKYATGVGIWDKRSAIPIFNIPPFLWGYNINEVKSIDSELETTM